MNKKSNHQFNISSETMVVTSTYVTSKELPILEVSHEDDEEGGSLWQFHCGNGDYSMDKMQLVRLDTILAIDLSVKKIASLQMGQIARRAKLGDTWDISG